jgi:hypothetical protein
LKSPVGIAEAHTIKDSQEGITYLETKENLMPRKSPMSIKVDGNVRCLRVYPAKDTKRTVENLETIGIKMNREQAIQLARVLLAVSQDWEEIDITGFRLRPRKADGTYGVTVTGRVD